MGARSRRDFMAPAPRSSHEVHVLTSILEATGCRGAHDSLTLMQCLRAYEAVLPTVRRLVSQIPAAYYVARHLALLR